ncbi:MAG: hypothetical protein C5B47_06825 [Verrucomicrobia bacterium]|nr:MAG: hypothetical protein C5B47_06825 [Verrucomicrobiota bacterium]
MPAGTVLWEQPGETAKAETKRIKFAIIEKSFAILFLFNCEKSKTLALLLNMGKCAYMPPVAEAHKSPIVGGA